MYVPLNMFKTRKSSLDCFNMWSSTNATYNIFNVGTFKYVILYNATRSEKNES